MTSPFDQISPKKIAELPKLTEEEARKELRNHYEMIIKVLRKYCDLKEEYYPLVAIWILGTHFHKEFITYPYLFFNAMKGSGKSRLLKLVLYLSHNGRMVNNLSEAVLFRTASQRTLGIDEFENIGSKDKNVLRELLNSAYKKGTSVERAKKSYSDEGDEWVIESYDVYCPIIMANISGMEEVLSDRCISLILEKSENRQITRLLELFEIDNYIKNLKLHEQNVVSAVTSSIKRTIGIDWNDYLLLTTLTTHTTLTTLNDTNNTNYNINLPFYKKVDESGLDSRHLELFFPLFALAYNLGEDVLDLIIKISQEIVSEKKGEDMMENRDVTFLHFIASSKVMFESMAENDFIREKDILIKFQEWIEFDEKNDDFRWCNPKWIGRALKRLNLIVEKKRMGKGIMVRINFKKAMNKSMMFKDSEIKTEKIIDEIPKIEEESKPEDHERPYNE